MRQTEDSRHTGTAKQPPGTMVDRASDGTPLFAPRGELAQEVEGSAVQCHLCGRWFRQLASSHLLHAHGLAAADYRLLLGLTRRHPLQACAVSERCAEQLRRQIAADPPARGEARGRDGLTPAASLASHRPMSLPVASERARSQRQSCSDQAVARRLASVAVERAAAHGEDLGAARAETLRGPSRGPIVIRLRGRRHARANRRTR